MFRGGPAVGVWRSQRQSTDRETVMTTLHIENTVRDYASWQEAFDKFERFRADNKVWSYRICRQARRPERGHRRPRVRLAGGGRGVRAASSSRSGAHRSPRSSWWRTRGADAHGGGPTTASSSPARSAGDAEAPRAPGRAHLPLLPSGPGGFSEIPPHGGLAQSLGGRFGPGQSGGRAGNGGRHTTGRRGTVV